TCHCFSRFFRNFNPHRARRPIHQSFSTLIFSTVSIIRFLTMTSEELGKIIAKFVSDPRSVLFVGAGIGCRVNLPGWKDLMAKLANICREYDEGVAGDLHDHCRPFMRSLMMDYAF